MILPNGLELKESPLGGEGIFACQDFPKETFLGHFTGTLYSLKDFKEKYGKDVRYCYQLGRQNKIICAKEERNFITFMNESITPNCYLKKKGCYTSQDIRAGDELTLRYKGCIKYPRDYSLPTTE